MEKGVYLLCILRIHKMEKTVRWLRFYFFERGGGGGDPGWKEKEKGEVVYEKEEGEM